MNNISLKSHNEILAQGSKFAKKNMWKMNLAHVGGLAYSTLALGVLLPKLNIYLANHSHNEKVKNEIKEMKTQNISMTGFMNKRNQNSIA